MRLAKPSGSLLSPSLALSLRRPFALSLRRALWCVVRFRWWLPWFWARGVAGSFAFACWFCVRSFLLRAGCVWVFLFVFLLALFCLAALVLAGLFSPYLVRRARQFSVHVHAYGRVAPGASLYRYRHWNLCPQHVSRQNLKYWSALLCIRSLFGSRRMIVS